MPNLDELLKAYGTIPELTSFKRPLFVGPHPDDIEFGCGGLLSKFKEAAVQPVFAIVTDGAAGTTDPAVTADDMARMRSAETKKAAEFFGVKAVEMLGLPDGGDYEVVDVIRALAPVILKYNPDVIFAPDAHLKTECHPDHLKVGEAVRRLTQLVSYPESMRRHGINVDGVDTFPSNITLALYFTDDANVFVPISEANLGEKMQALMMHESQMAGDEAKLLLAYFQLKAQKLGGLSESPTGLAEDYQVMVPLMMHVYSEGLKI